jgi:hypothetical protein
VNERDQSRLRHPSSPLTSRSDLTFTGTGQLVRYHLSSVCAGHPCPMHNPSDHHMVTWPLHFRADLSIPLMERICEHGCGHPDPDSLAYVKRRFSATWAGVHGCCGCCGPLPKSETEQ